MWTTIGARLLNLFFRNLVCMSAFYNAFALVGCGWNNGSAGGLWCWSCWSVSTGTNINIGARLIIWDLMCKSTFNFYYHLSAVVGLMILDVAYVLGILVLCPRLT